MGELTNRAEERTTERRVSVRYRSDHLARFQLRGAERLPSRWARMHDVSTGGLSLRLCGDMRPGSRLTVEFTGGGSPRRAVEADVVHSTAQGDGTWVVGCRLALPLADEEVRRLASFEEPAAQTRAGARTTDLSEPTPPAVLIVDADPDVRAVLVKFLRLQGVRALEAVHWLDAVSLLLVCRSPVSLAFIDLHLPGLDGVDTLKALKEARPDLECCLMGGGDEDEQELLAAGACSVLPKPFALAQVAVCLSRLPGLDRPAARGPLATSSC